jgi:hypothetical protein
MSNTYEYISITYRTISQIKTAACCLAAGMPSYSSSILHCFAVPAPPVGLPSCSFPSSFLGNDGSFQSLDLAALMDETSLFFSHFYTQK